MENIDDSIGSQLIELVLLDLSFGNDEQLRDVLAELHPAEQAHILESLPPEQRARVWALVDKTLHGEVISYLHEEVRTSIVDEMPTEQLVAAAEVMNVEDLAEVLETLPEDISDSIIEELESDYRQRLELIQSFEEHSVGRLMSHEVVSVRPDVNVAVVLRWLRRQKELPIQTDALLVVDEQGHYLGKLDISTVLTSMPEVLVSEIMRPNVDSVLASTSEHDLLAMFERRDLISMAVISEDNILLGRVGIENVLLLMREESERTLLKQAGLDEEEDLFAPMIPSAKRRGLWLGINLITVFLAAWVIGQFEEVLDKFVALAVLMPVVASMGGIAGSQTLTLVIRGMALDQIASSNVRWLAIKEVGVGALNGLVWSLIVACVSYLWFREPAISIIIATAMMLNLLAAALSGIFIPLILKRLGIDPALSGAVVLTTVTDIIGFLSFLGLASLFLL
ncbi:MAG: magnesium transporter [Gammaproteobacteria bacterium]|nr:magnesium transporter [Gammaproteobacteria bacterium]